MTRIRSAESTVDSRCATTRAVLPDRTPESASRIPASVAGSTLDVASIEREQRRSLAKTHEEVAAAIAAAEESSRPGAVRGPESTASAPDENDRNTAEGDPGEPPAQ